MRAGLLLALVGCAANVPSAGDPDAARPDAAPRDASGAPDAGTRSDAMWSLDASPPDAAAPDAAPPLVVEYLGVGGFSMRVGEDQILTAPLFSNPSLDRVLSANVAADPARIDEALRRYDVSRARAILVGHAHYDHLMDVPYVWPRTREAFIYGNEATLRLLAAHAEPRNPACNVGGPRIPRDRIVALNSTSADRVDRRSCATANACGPGTGARAGEWTLVPGTRIRVMALCSAHPAQFLFVHLGRGCMRDTACEPPRAASEWREGETLAYLIDFLDAESDRVRYRLYYQDAPADAPVGHVPAALLAERGVDVALLCVGSYDQVADHPGQIVRNLSPRYAIGGHWEDFFRPQTEPLRPIPFMDVAPFRAALEALLPPDAQGPRAFIPNPGDQWRIAEE